MGKIYSMRLCDLNLDIVDLLHYLEFHISDPYSQGDKYTQAGPVGSNCNSAHCHCNHTECIDPMDQLTGRLDLCRIPKHIPGKSSLGSQVGNDILQHPGLEIQLVGVQQCPALVSCKNRKKLLSTFTLLTIG